jgi:hypothetical protein
VVLAALHVGLVAAGAAGLAGAARRQRPPGVLRPTMTAAAILWLLLLLAGRA